VTDPDPTLPPDRIAAKWGVTEGAVVDVTGYTPPQPIPLERQHVWGRAFQSRPPHPLSIIDKMALKAALEKGSPLLGGFQRSIIELEGQGFTPETWRANEGPANDEPGAEVEAQEVAEGETPQVGRIFLITPSSTTNDRLARDVARDVVAALPAGRRVVLDLTSTFPGDHLWPVRRVVTALESSSPEEVAAKVLAYPGFPPQVLEGRLAELAGHQRIGWFHAVLERLVESGAELVICAPAPGAKSDDPVLALAGLPNAIVLACADGYRGMTDDEYETFGKLRATAGGPFYGLVHAAPGEAFGVPEGDPETRGELEIYPLDFTSRYAASTGFALVREWFDLRFLPLPQGLNFDVEREIVDRFAWEGIDLPYIPKDAAEEIVRLERNTFATDNWDVSADDAYMYRPAVDSVLADWQPRIAITLGGYGGNSYAWTYVLVAHGIAVVGQVHRGLGYANPKHTGDVWATLLDGVQRLHWAAQTLDIPDDRLLLVEWNTLRDVSRWRCFGRHVPGIDGIEEMDSREVPDRGFTGDVFESAISEGLPFLALP
jgi:hypothetical protein